MLVVLILSPQEFCRGRVREERERKKEMVVLSVEKVKTQQFLLIPSKLI